MTLLTLAVFAFITAVAVKTLVPANKLHKVRAAVVNSPLRKRAKRH